MLIAGGIDANHPAAAQAQNRHQGRLQLPSLQLPGAEYANVQDGARFLVGSGQVLGICHNPGNTKMRLQRFPSLDGRD